MCSDDTARIPLRARDGSVRAHALIDTADAAFVNRWQWILLSTGYAGRFEKAGGRTTLFYLHRELLGLAHGDRRQGDHVNLDRLDNRRQNLRALPRGKNQQNTGAGRGASQYRGVSWNTRHRKWKVTVSVNGKNRHLGYFSDELEAAEVARAARLQVMQYATS